MNIERSISEAIDQSYVISKGKQNLGNLLTTMWKVKKNEIESDSANSDDEYN